MESDLAHASAGTPGHEHRAPHFWGRTQQLELYEDQRRRPNYDVHGPPASTFAQAHQHPHYPTRVVSVGGDRGASVSEEQARVQLPRLPSLSDQVPMPEAHPDHFAMVNLTRRRPTPPHPSRHSHHSRPDQAACDATPSEWEYRQQQRAHPAAQFQERTSPARMHHVFGGQTEHAPPKAEEEYHRLTESPPYRWHEQPFFPTRPPAPAEPMVSTAPPRLTPRPIVENAAVSHEAQRMVPSLAQEISTLGPAMDVPQPSSPVPARLYPTSHRVSVARYATSADPRGYIPVYEYSINGHYIMIDSETSRVHFTGIWKALGHTKADIVRLLEASPELERVIHKVRGGFLKIQGTWMPYSIAMELSRRTAYRIGHDLVPLFGPGFPATCLTPEQPGFGQLMLVSNKKQRRRAPNPSAHQTSCFGPPKPVQFVGGVLVDPVASHNAVQYHPAKQQACLSVQPPPDALDIAKASANYQEAIAHGYRGDPGVWPPQEHKRYANDPRHFDQYHVRQVAPDARMSMVKKERQYHLDVSAAECRRYDHEMKSGRPSFSPPIDDSLMKSSNSYREYPAHPNPSMPHAHQVVDYRVSDSRYADHASRPEPFPVRRKHDRYSLDPRMENNGNGTSTPTLPSLARTASDIGMKRKADQRMSTSASESPPILPPISAARSNPLGVSALVDSSEVERGSSYGHNKRRKVAPDFIGRRVAAGVEPDNCIAGASLHDGEVPAQSGYAVSRRPSSAPLPQGNMLTLSPHCPDSSPLPHERSISWERPVSVSPSIVSHASTRQRRSEMRLAAPGSTQHGYGPCTQDDPPGYPCDSSNMGPGRNVQRELPPRPAP